MLDLGPVDDASACLTLAKAYPNALVKDGKCYATYMTMSEMTSASSSKCTAKCTSGEECGGAESTNKFSLYTQVGNSFTVKGSHPNFKLEVQTPVKEDSYFLLKSQNSYQII